MTDHTALIAALERKYSFFARFSFEDGTEHETMILLSAAASALSSVQAERDEISARLGLRREWWKEERIRVKKAEADLAALRAVIAEAKQRLTTDLDPYDEGHVSDTLLILESAALSSVPAGDTE